MEYKKNNQEVIDKSVFKAVIPEDGISIDSVEREKRIVGFVTRMNKEQFAVFNDALKEGTVLLKIIKQ